MSPGSPNTVAARETLAVLGPADARLVEDVVIQHGHAGHGWLSRELLRDPDETVRGEASLWFGLGPGDHAAALPDDWYPDWAEAFAVAPLKSAHGDNYRLGEVLTALVGRDADLVERWFAAQIATNPEHAVFNLPDETGASLSHLPRPNRDRLMRAVQGRWNDWEILAVLLGADTEWLNSLLDEGVIGTDDVIMTLDHGDREVEDRVQRLLRFAPVLVPRGVDPRHLASGADLGGWMGERSEHYERIRQAFGDARGSEDPSVQEVIAAGMDIYERARDQAKREEHDRRVSGEL